jgi:hypothetical protein
VAGRGGGGWRGLGLGFRRGRYAVSGLASGGHGLGLGFGGRRGRGGINRRGRADWVITFVGHALCEPCCPACLDGPL